MDRLPLAVAVSALCLCGTFVARAAAADSPRVHFDMPFTVACREVAAPEFSAANPGQKLVEARFDISSLLVAGREQDLTQFFIRIESPQRTLSVVDYLPKTLHESRHAGPIKSQETDEQNASIGINLAGQYELLTGSGLNAGLGKKHVSCVTEELLPPLETVAASGTLLRGSAVFFKLKASPRNLLEGAREYAMVLRVPADWRADYVQVRCSAEGIERSFVSSLDQTIPCGQRDFLVALYLEGDESARVTAEAFARRKAAEVQGPKSKVQGSSRRAEARHSIHLPSLLTFGQ